MLCMGMFVGFGISVYPCIPLNIPVYYILLLYILVYPCGLLVRLPQNDLLRVVRLPSPVAAQVLSAQQLKDRLLQEIDLDELEEGLDPEERTNHAHLPEQLFQHRSSCRQHFYRSACRDR